MYYLYYSADQELYKEAREELYISYLLLILSVLFEFSLNQLYIANPKARPSLKPGLLAL